MVLVNPPVSVGDSPLHFGGARKKREKVEAFAGSEPRLSFPEDYPVHQVRLLLLVESTLPGKAQGPPAERYAGHCGANAFPGLLAVDRVR